MTKRQQLIFIYLLMNTVMSLCMSAAGLWVNVGRFTLRMYLVTLAQSLVICNVCTLVFRTPSLCGRAAAALAGGRRDSRLFRVCNTFLNATMNTVYMVTFMTLLNLGFRPEYFRVWLRGFPVQELVSVTVSFLAEPFMLKLARRA